MSKPFIAIALAAVACAAAGCTERRTAEPAVADGDTIEVVIPQKVHPYQERPVRIIEINDDSAGVVMPTPDSPAISL